MIKETPLTRAFWQDLRLPHCPIYDMHGHLGRYYGIWFPRPSAEEMVRSMDRANVRMLCFASHAALFAPDLGNRTAVQAVRQYPGRLRAYLSVNPNHPEHIRRDLSLLDEHPDAFVGLKLHPEKHQVPATAPAYAPALQVAEERELLVLVHSWGGSRHNGPEQMRTLAARHPGIALILGHSLHGAWDEAVKIARDFAHVYLDLTALLDNDRGVIEKFADAGLADRMLFGTDLPWFSPVAALGCLLSADITDEDRHAVLHGNAEGLLARFPGLP